MVLEHVSRVPFCFWPSPTPGFNLLDPVSQFPHGQGFVEVRKASEGEVAEKHVNGTMSSSWRWRVWCRMTYGGATPRDSPELPRGFAGLGMRGRALVVRAVGYIQGGRGRVQSWAQLVGRQG